MIPPRRAPLPEGAWNPGVGKALGTTYAIASDLSEVIKTEDGFGIFPTELEATKRWIEMLEAEREVTAERLTRARRRRRTLQARAA